MTSDDRAAATKQSEASTGSERFLHRQVFTSSSYLPQSLRPVLIILGVVLLANIAYVTGLANNDPLAWTSGIAHSTCGLICGRSSTDINVGIITQPLGHLAAMDVLHGHLPWWNAFEGLGQPLAGELQSSALFPLVLLFALPGGLVWFHIVLEFIAGVSTYFLARRLGVRETFAVVGGALFALNGTFSWLANSVVNPIAFLPMLLLGVEIVFARASEPIRRGWYVLAIATALSIYAGFPEVAYLDGIFSVVWALVRLRSVRHALRWRAARRLGLGAVVGGALSLPALVAFGDYLRVAYVGGHVLNVDGSWSLPTKSLPMLFDPYIYGTIYGNRQLFTAWGEIGGYFGASVCALALVGLFGARLRGLRIFLFAWVIAGLLGAFNIYGARAVWNLVPLLSTTSVPRYIMPSCELALVVLAVLGLSDLSAHFATRRRLTWSALFMAAVLAGGAITAHELNHQSVLDTRTRIVLLILNILPFVAVAAIVLASRLPERFNVTLIVSAVLVGETLLLFMAPTFSAPRHVSADHAPIHFLQTHQGEGRFVDLTILPPNWGSQFGLSALNATDLPFPKSFEVYIQRNLFPGLKPADAFTRDRTSGILEQEQALATHLQSYEDASVKYLLAPRTLTLLPALSALGVRVVWHDALATIYALPHPRPFFSSTCNLVSHSYTTATVTCPSSGATLLRTELAMPGWSAQINGRTVPIRTVDGVYQQIALPSGTSHVQFDFLPPHEDLALLVGVLALTFLVGSAACERLLRRIRKSASVTSPITKQ
jgi:hypothetical protein